MDRLTNMEAFVRVVNAGGFSAAAKQWGVSKAVLSKYVAALEAHLGVLLLRRTTRSVTPTDAGRMYYARSVELLGEIESLESTLRQTRLAPRGRLRVTMTPDMMVRYRARFTTEFTARYPEVEMDIHLTHRMVDLVEEGFDLAIRVTAPRDSSLIARRLAGAPLVAVAAPGYLSSRGVPRRARDLERHDCLVDTNFRDAGRWPFRAGGKQEVIDVKGPIRVNSPVETRELAIAGHGIALVPAFLVSSALATGTLVEVLPGKVALDWAVYVLYPHRRHVTAKVRAFLSHLVEVFDESTDSDDGTRGGKDQ